MSEPTQKACPCLVRPSGDRTELLVFKNPLAGIQLVKGTVEPDETPEDAAVRELYEESGIRDARILRRPGEWSFPDFDQVWHVFLVEAAEPLPDRWKHWTEDGGGHLFAFEWHDIDQPLVTRWPQVWDKARKKIRAALADRT